MSQGYRKQGASSFQIHDHNKVELKANLELNYHLVSSSALEQLEEYSDSSTKFDYSLSLFALSFGIIITLMTGNITDSMIHDILMCSAVLTFTIGVFCYWLHRKGKGRISQLVEKIKNTKCTLL